MSNIRFEALKIAWSHNNTPVSESSLSTRPLKDYFGERVFTRQKMTAYIDDDVLRQLDNQIENAKPLTRDIANSVAVGMRKWAMELGATHYTHWFQPLTGGTAEKHDAFFSLDADGKAIEAFGGEELYQSEPDASSFPSGGLRNTFEARGYSAWDPTSPAFVIGDRLCIPTIFVAYTGEALDYKTPLLRSITAIDQAATAVAQYFDQNVKHVQCNLGWEQEYFLVDEALYQARPDLVLTGRTLIGHPSGKSQQLGDHYLAIIPERVLAFMSELEIESLRLGIPVQTRHNEVAPNQFEITPVFENVNLSSDHNQLIMSLMESIARKHNFHVLLHEKPFAEVNGSGKHCNWSLQTNTGTNLLSPGKDQYHNLLFVTFLVNVLMAVQRHNGLLKASIISASNAHRLGANEAPPTIISIFLGTQLTEALNQIANADTEDGILINAKKEMKLIVGNIPEILLDNTDRNRTSPFAFTGNRFEFRAVGSSANCGAAMLALNAAVAEQLILFREAVEQLIKSGDTKERALFTVIKRYIRESQAIHFEGNGYSNEWRIEATKRGLDCETSVPVIIDQYLTPSTISMFERTRVLSHSELLSRCAVKWDNYSIKQNIESRVLNDLVLNHVLSTAKRYQTMLLQNVVAVKQVFQAEEVSSLNEQDYTIIRSIEEKCRKIVANVTKIKAEQKSANVITDSRAKAIAFHDNIVPLMDIIRKNADDLEMIVDDELWPLPKYREMLFIH